MGIGQSRGFGGETAMYLTIIISTSPREFFREPGADREQIEMEYQDAKARLAAAERASVEWDERTGTAPLRKQCDRADYAEVQAAMRMARTKPTTPSGRPPAR